MRTQPTPSAASSIASNSYPSRSTPSRGPRLLPERVIRRARATAPVVLRSSKRENGFSINSTHASYWTEYAMYKGKDRELQFRTRSVSPTTTATAARTAKSSVDMACDLTDRTPKQVETLYRKRSAIETSYRTYPRSESNHHTTPDPLIRFVLVAVGFLLRNLWLVVRWTVVARPRRGGRDLPTEFTFELVCGWIRDHLSTELGWQYTWETNGVGLPPGYAWPRPDRSQAAGSAFPEQQLSTKCANRAAEKTLTRVSVCFTLTQPFHTIDLSSKSWCGPRRSKTESGTT